MRYSFMNGNDAYEVIQMQESATYETTQETDSGLELSHDELSLLDAQAFIHLCNYLECSKEQITHIIPIKTGLTNQSFKLSVEGDYKLKGAVDPASGICFGDDFVYRIPSHLFDGTMIYREHEALAEQEAKRLGLDPSFVYMDPQMGWKLSHYLPQSKPCEYKDFEELKEATILVKSLHEAKLSVGRRLDMLDFYLSNYGKLGPFTKEIQKLHTDIAAMVQKLAAIWRARSKQTDKQAVLCHVDFWPRNVLKWPGGLALIDWEYCCDTDPLVDLATMCNQSTLLTDRQVYELFAAYYGQEELEDDQWLDAQLAISICAAFWTCWCLKNLSMDTYENKDLSEELKLFEAYHYNCIHFGQQALSLAAKK